jgi:hypothetical protein
MMKRYLPPRRDTLGSEMFWRLGWPIIVGIGVLIPIVAAECLLLRMMMLAAVAEG